MVTNLDNPARFLGIDMAGDSGKTVCVWLEADRDSSGAVRGLAIKLVDAAFTGAAGLDRLCSLSGDAMASAIDSPFGYPRHTLALLNGRSGGDGAAAKEFRYRATDLAMRERLRSLELSTSYVVSPLRLELIRRTLLLLDVAGQEIAEARLGRAPFLETNARLAVVEMLCQCSATWSLHVERRLIADYRRTEKKRRDQAEEARRAILFRLGSEINRRLGKGFLRFPSWREVAREPAAFDALFCAFGALADALDVRVSYPEARQQPRDVAQVEGWVFVPNWPRLFEVLAAQAPTAGGATPAE